MKKILSVLCVLALVASFACLSVSAADASAIDFSLVARPAESADQTTLVVDLVANLKSGTCTSATFLLNPVEGLELASCVAGNAGGMFQTSQNVTDTPYMIIWVLGTASVTDGAVIATLTFNLPADVEDGATFDFTEALTLDADNPTVDLDGNELNGNGAAIANAVVTYTAYAEPTTATEATEATTEAPATEAPATTAAPATTTTTEAPATTTTEAPATTAANKAPATGDMMFVVVAVMVVALGAAVVVKKVNVK